MKNNIVGENMDFKGIKTANICSGQQVSEIANMMQREFAEERRKNQQAEENHDNLEYLVKNSQETIDVLKDMNLVLKKHVELLESENSDLQNSLAGVSDILHELLIVDIQNGDEQRMLMQQANALACEIAVALDSGEKVNWKDKAADGGVQVILSAIAIFLRMNGFNI